MALRVRNRTGHDVPAAEIFRRWTAVQNNLARTAPLFANILLLDNSGAHARVVAQAAGKEVVRYVALLPRWAVDLVARIDLVDRVEGTRAR